MLNNIEDLKQTEKEKLTNWETELATKSDITQIKAEEEEATSIWPYYESWRTWVIFMLVTIGLIVLFSGFNFDFNWWWFFILSLPFVIIILG